MKNKLIRADINRVIGERLEVSLVRAGEITNIILGIISESVLGRGEGVYIRGFGAFVPRRTKARDWKSPLTGKRVKLKRSLSVKFKAYDKLLTLINQL